MHLRTGKRRSEIGTLRVLAYHRIAGPDQRADLDPGLLSATPEAFAKQMEHLSRNFHVVSVDQVLQAVQSSTRLPDRSILLTFDDGYRDFAECAWPILRQYALPAVLFIATAYPGGSHEFWWDRLYRAVHNTDKTTLRLEKEQLDLSYPACRSRTLNLLKKRVKSIKQSEAVVLVDQVCSALDSTKAHGSAVLDWTELRQLASEGVSLGPHTRTHPIMTRLNLGELEDEVCGSLRDLRSNIGSALPIFCYPNGSQNYLVDSILRREGVVLAFTTMDGHNDLGSQDLLRLRRTTITPRTSARIFRLRLHKYVTYIDLWRHRAHRVA